MGLEEYSRRFEIVTKLVIGPILNRKDVTGPDRLKYYNFAKELYKTPNINGLINEYVEENADREILKWITEKRGSICNALRSGEDAQHKVLRELRRKYLKP
jgi:hypothetical protein